MSDNQFLIRSPLVSPAHQILGYELSWYSSVEGGALSGDEELLALTSFASSQLIKSDGTWLLGSLILFFEVTPAVLASEQIEVLPPANTVFRMTLADLSDGDTLQRARALRQLGYGISLCNADDLPNDSPLLSVISHAEGAFGKSGSNVALFKQAGVQTLVRQVDDWDTFDACLADGLPVFIGNLYNEPRVLTTPKGLSPAQVIIVQLMDMVRKNADVRQLEEVLKRDAALSYKLFRYINSASFGLGVEIQSLRHAVTMLGYSPLYRWLSLLLAALSDNSQAALLMQTAIVRGRIAELAGHGILPKHEAENLFVVGMFSLLDRLLGMPMNDVLGHIHLSDAVSQALLTRDGMYGPFLTLAESCEKDNGPLAATADSLFIRARQINEAHLEALAWSQKIKP